MCTRSFVKRSIFEKNLNITVNDCCSFNATLAENDKRKLLFITVYDTTTERYVGGAL